MACYKPLKGYVKASGGITFRRNESTGFFMQVPCGRCIGCRLDYARDWAVRCWHESSLYDDNCFITLTYEEDPITLQKKDFQNFMKRLRKEYAPRKIRFFHCGEYGSTCSEHRVKNCAVCGPIHRPHYHAVLFNLDFEDKEFYMDRNGYPVWTSEKLTDIWSHGKTEVGTVTFESAGYTARYMTKKINGEKAQDHYRRLVVQTGELFPVLPEYTTMSRRPGIGLRWIERYWRDVYPCDFVVLNGGVKVGVPRYYDNWLLKNHPEMYERIKRKRIRSMLQSVDNTDERLEVREVVKLAQMGFLNRGYDNAV